MAPRCAAPNEAACRSCSGSRIAAGGSNAMAPQRSTAPAAPIINSTVGPIVSRAENANSTISANTPIPHSTPMVVPLMPAARHSSVEKP